MSLLSFPFFFPSLPLSLSVCYMSPCLIQFSVSPFLFLTHSLIPLYLGLSLILSISLSHCLSICICLSDCLYLSLSLSLASQRINGAFVYASLRFFLLIHPSSRQGTGNFIRGTSLYQLHTYTQPAIPWALDGTCDGTKRIIWVPYENTGSA